MVAGPAAFVVSFVVFLQTTWIDGAHHTVDACIPTVEVLLGAVLGLLAGTWLARKFYRGLKRPDAQGPWAWSTETNAAVVALIVALVGWVAAMRLIGPRICPTQEPDYICDGGLVLAPAAALVAIVCAEILQRAITRRRARST